MKYEKPLMNVVVIDSQDVVTASPGGGLIEVPGPQSGGDIGAGEFENQN